MKQQEQLEKHVHYKNYKFSQCGRSYKLRLEMDRSSTSPIIEFYFKKGMDQFGHMLENIWSFLYLKLEKLHNYIQCLFPTTEKSKHNHSAPVLTCKDIKQLFKPYHQKTLIKNLQMMLNFYIWSHPSSTKWHG